MLKVPALHDSLYYFAWGEICLRLIDNTVDVDGQCCIGLSSASLESLHIFLISFDAEASPLRSCSLQNQMLDNSVVHILPEGVDDDDEVGGNAHVAADEAADESHVARAVPVVVDHLNDLDAVVDEGDHCQHDPGNQQASLALWVIIFVRLLQRGWIF